MKTCTKCKLTFPLSNFYLQDGKPKARCKSCIRTYDKNRQREKYNANPEEEKSRKRTEYNSSTDIKEKKRKKNLVKFGKSTIEKRFLKHLKDTIQKTKTYSKRMPTNVVPEKLRMVEILPHMNGKNLKSNTTLSVCVVKRKSQILNSRRIM